MKIPTRKSRFSEFSLLMTSNVMPNKIFMGTIISWKKSAHTGANRTQVSPHLLDIQYSDRQLMVPRVTLKSWEEKEQKASGQLA